MAKEKEKKSILPLILIIVLVAVAGVFAFKYFTRPRVEKIPLQAKLEDASNLTTQKLTVSDCFEEKTGKIPIINKKNYLVKYIATVDAGFDIKEAKIIEDTDKKVVVSIPHCSIIEKSVNVRGEDIKTYDTSLAIFNPSADAVFKLEKEAEKKALKYAKTDESGLLVAADANAKNLVQGIITSAANGREVVVQFAEEKK